MECWSMCTPALYNSDPEVPWLVWTGYETPAGVGLGHTGDLDLIGAEKTLLTFFSPPSVLEEWRRSARLLQEAASQQHRELNAGPDKTAAAHGGDGGVGSLGSWPGSHCLP